MNPQIIAMDAETILTAADLQNVGNWLLEEAQGILGPTERAKLQLFRWSLEVIGYVAAEEPGFLPDGADAPQTSKEGQP